MKKINKKGILHCILESKILIVMKLTTFFFFVSVFTLFASDIYSQSKTITIKKDNALVKDILEEVEDNSDFYFIFNNEYVDVYRKVDVHVEDQTVTKLLDEIFDGHNVGYTVDDRRIILFPSEERFDSEQARNVKGVVTDSSGEFLPGVTIIIKGTTIGTVTDFEGNFNLANVPGDATLVFSFVGMRSEEVVVASQAKFNIVLEADAIGVDEVVVTALGVRRDRKTIGYAISKVTGEDLVKSGAPANAFSALHGKAAGVTIRESVSGPTGGIDINIRGNNALEYDANTRPLIVVDGVPIFDQESSIVNNNEYKGDFGAGINDLNAMDIESMEILKGAKASVLYGSEGANGVVLITTKSGKNKKGLGVEVSYQTTIERPKSYMKFQNEFGTGNNEYDHDSLDINGVMTPVINGDPYSFGPKFDGRSKLYFDGVTRPYQAYPNNFMFFYENGHNNTVNASVSSSGDMGHTRLSFTNSDYQGITPDFWQKKNTVSFAGKINASKMVSIDFSTNIYDIRTHNRQRAWAVGMVNGINRDIPYEELVANDYHLITDPDDPNFGYKRTGDYRETLDPNYVDGIIQSYYPLSAIDAFWNRDKNSYTDEKFHIIGSVRPTIRFNDWLFIVGQASIDYTAVQVLTKESPTEVYPGIEGGRYRNQKETKRVEEFRAFLNFEKDFDLFGRKLNVYAFGGPTYRNTKNDKLYGSTYGDKGPAFTYPDWFHLSNQSREGWGADNRISQYFGENWNEKEMHSLIGVATVTWDYKHTIELNARNDWTSTILTGENSYFYPGIAYTYNFTDALKSSIPILQFGKFRASFADVGRDAPSTYFAYQSLAASVANGTNVNMSDVSKDLFGGIIKPERKREWEFGTEMNFFKGNRLNIDASFYTNHVYDQIIGVNVTPESGAGTIKINAGDVKNWGYELQLSGTPILTKDFRWNMVFNAANQFNKIIELYPGLPQKQIHSMSHGLQVLAREGERSGNIYGVGPRIAESGEFAGRPIVLGSGIGYDLDDQKQINVGNIYPNVMGGVSTDFNYKGFRLSALVDYSFGATLFSWKNYVLKGTGTSIESLPGRTEEYGGLAYYVDDVGNNVTWDHNQAAPSASSNGLVYHDGIMIEGVVEDATNPNNVTYKENDVIVSAGDYYYTNYVYWTGGQLLDAVNDKYKNDYIKLREISLGYTVPQRIVRKLKLQKLAINLFARNLGYIYKSLPNFDAESASGTKAYIGGDVLPTTQSYGIQISLGI